MKKFITICLMLLLCFGVNLLRNDVNVQAEQAYIHHTITREMVITEDTPFSYIQFDVALEDVNTQVCFTIKSGAKLTLTDCIIDGTVEGSPNAYVYNFFVVEKGGILELKNVSFVNIDSSGLIANNGVLYVDNVTFPSGVNSIINSIDLNELENPDCSIFLRSGNLGRVKLSSGYIAIDKDSKVSGTSTIILDASVQTGTLVVKGIGQNVFANKYLDNFVYSAQSETKFLDYIGDHDSSTTITDVVTGVQLQAGDIVYTTLSSSLISDYKNSSVNKITYPATNCSANHLLNIQGYLFRNSALVKLNNYLAQTTSATYTRVASATGKTTTVTINVMKDGASNPESTTTLSPFVTGSNRAVFVDIPQGGYKFKTAEYYVNGELNNNVLQLSSEVYSNGVYIRPIIEFDPEMTTYANNDVTINIIFAEIPKEASVNVVTTDAINVSYDEEMFAGSEYKFTIPFVDSIIINDVYFNNAKVTLSENANSYYFVTTVNETNTLRVDSTRVLNIVPNPSKTTFVYGEEVVLSEEYEVEETNETIIINYTPNACRDADTYTITTATCDNSKYKTNYQINIIEGENPYTYTIGPQEIDLEEVVTTKDVDVTYSSELALNAEMFIVSKPDYLVPALDLSQFDPIAGDQTLYINFTLTSSNYAFKDFVRTLGVNLNISPAQIEDDKCGQFDNESVDYTGENIEILVEGYDSNLLEIEYTYYLKKDESTYEEVSYAKDSGVYKVVATFASKHSLYTINKTMTAELEIKMVTVDLSDYLEVVSLYNFIYDGTIKYVDTKSSLLPSMVSISSVENNVGFVNADTYNVIIHLEYDKKNYVCVDSCVSVLVIAPKKVNVALENNSFDYSGTAPVLKAVVSGLIGSDECNVILSSDVRTDAGDHTVTVNGLSNSNYESNQSSLAYEINQVVVDLSSVYFDNITATYDGERHLPVLTGVLPAGVIYTIDNNVTCKDVGVYQVKCKFVSNNPNYIAPATIYSTVTISKRPIYVAFEEPTNMIANGTPKTIIVSFTNVIVGDSLNYEENYSSPAINAGEYTLIINLNEKNYYIANSNTYVFTVFTNTLSLNTEGVTVKVEGKFTDTDAVEVSKINNIHVDTALEGENIKGYTTLEFIYTNYSTSPIKVSIKSSGVVSDTRYLKVYRVVGTELEEIDFDLDGDIITFNLSSNSAIVFAEGNTKAYTYRFAIGTICALALLSAIGYVCFITIYLRGRNPYIALNKNKSK